MSATETTPKLWYYYRLSDDSIASVEIASEHPNCVIDASGNRIWKDGIFRTPEEAIEDQRSDILADIAHREKYLGQRKARLARFNAKFPEPERKS